jgi:hypothetical protein
MSESGLIADIHADIRPAEAFICEDGPSASIRFTNLPQAAQAPQR